MIRHYCDGCGVEVDGENGIVGMKEITIEQPTGKVSIAMEVATLKDGHEQDSPAVCAVCVSKRVAEWADSISDAPVAQRREHRTSNANVEGSNPSGGAN
jgi:hypothetical protein